MRRIICLGNRYLDEDAAGPKVFDLLSRMPLPDAVEIVDGGTAGLNLLGLIEGAKCVVFVDAVSEYGAPGDIVVLTRDDLPKPGTMYDHAAGLPYLIAVMPLVCVRVPSDVFIVGIEGLPSDQAIAEAARVSIAIASAGLCADGTATLPGRGL